MSGNAGQVYTGEYDVPSLELFTFHTIITDFPSNVFALTGNSTYEIANGSDWAGIILTDNDGLGSTSVVPLAKILCLYTYSAPLLISVQRSWFLRDNESGLHSFVRLAYYNKTFSKGELGEVRTMFRPNSPVWTTLVTNDEQWVRTSRCSHECDLTDVVVSQAPIPSAEAVADEIVVQDA